MLLAGWVKVKMVVTKSVRLFATLWTVAHQAPLSMEFSRQEYQSGLPFSSPRGSSQPRDRTQVSSIAGEFFPEPPGKPSGWVVKFKEGVRKCTVHPGQKSMRKQLGTRKREVPCSKCHVATHSHNSM